MNKIKKSSYIFVVLIGILLLFTACNSNDTGGKSSANEKNGSNEVNKDGNIKNENNEEPREQVTIKIAMPLNEEYFEGRFGEVDRALEHIDLEFVPYASSIESLEEIFSNKLNPDIIIGTYGPVKHAGVGYPLDDLIDEWGFDMDSLNPSLVSFMQSLGDDGEIVGLPDGGSFFGLYYNKEVFDKLGVDYPDPDVPMTWPEIVELSREMTREIGGEQFIGLQGGPGAALGSLAVQLTDPDTGDILFENNEDLKMYFDLMQDYYNIPGIDNPDIPENPFVESKTAAMIIASNNYFAWGWGSPEPEAVESIDIAPIPVWEHLPETTPAIDAWPMVIAEYSEHKEEAFEVLMKYLEPEIQVDMAKKMVLQTPSIDSQILDHYGEEVPQYEGKNIEAYFRGSSAQYKGRISQWDGYVDIGETQRRIQEDQIDVVTAIRELAEESKWKIKEAMEEQ